MDNREQGKAKEVVEKSVKELVVGDSTSIAGHGLVIEDITAPQAKEWESIMMIYDLKVHDAHTLALEDTLAVGATETLAFMQAQDAKETAEKAFAKYKESENEHNKQKFIEQAYQATALADALEKQMLDARAEQQANYLVSADARVVAEFNASTHYVHWLLGLEEGLDDFRVSLSDEDKLKCRQVVVLGKLPLGLSRYQSAQKEKLDEYLQEQVNLKLAPLISQLKQSLTEGGKSSRSQPMERDALSMSGKRDRLRKSSRELRGPN